QQSGEQQSEQPDGEQQDDVQLQSNEEETTSATEPEIGNADNNEGGEGSEQEGGGSGNEAIINTAVGNAAQSTTVYMTAKRFTSVPSSAMKLTVGDENNDNTLEIDDASGTPAPDEASATQDTPDPNGAAQVDLSAGQSKGKTSFEAKFTNTYTPDSTRGEKITGKKILNGRDLNEGEFEFALYTVEEDGDLDKKLLTVNNDVNGEFVFDMSTELYSKVGVYKYAVVEVKGDLGGVTYDEARFDIIVTVTDNNDNGTLKAETVIKDKFGTETEKTEIKFVNEYVPAKASFAIGGKKELKGDAYSGEAFSFSLYKADSAFAKVGTALETVNKSEAGSFTFAQIDYTEAGEHYYLVEEVKGSVAGMVYDSTVYGVTVTVTDNGLGQLIVDHETVKIGGDEVEEILFSNTYTKPAVTPTPTIPVTPTPTPGIMPTPPLDDVEIPIYPDDSGVPPTGDDNPIGLYVAILLISAGAIAGLVVTGKTGKKYRKRKKRFHAR
ncbi:MAG: hypothetical protein IJN83_06230, partial [Clostridia bacterium]|nr:hypothetical protein [Clostridia bacterium]